MFRHVFATAALLAQVVIAASEPASPHDQCPAAVTTTVQALSTTLDTSTASAPSNTPILTTITTTLAPSWTTIIATVTPVAVTSTVTSVQKSAATSIVQEGSSGLPATTSAKAPSPPTEPPPPLRNGTLKNMVYFPNWGIYARDFHPQDLKTDHITHVLYAFGDINSQGEIISSDTWSDLEKPYPGDSQTEKGGNAYGCIKQLYLQKKKNRSLKTLLSIGGWTYSVQKKFDVASTPEGRLRFANSAVKLLADWGFDGIDLDWEYPEDREQAQWYVDLLKAVRERLDEYAAENGQHYHYLLTVAAGAGPEKYRIQHLKEMDKYIDTWHLMAYDYAGAWDKSAAAHSSNLFPASKDIQSTMFDTDQAVKDYIANEISPSKIILGLPLYGRSFGGTEGLGKPFVGVGGGSYEQGIWVYKDLPRPGSDVHFDKALGASYSYNNETKELVSFDDVQSTKAKANYIKNKHLGGAFYWDASGDKKGEGSLVETMAQVLGKLDKSSNMLEYPASKYDNIRNGMAGA